MKYRPPGRYFICRPPRSSGTPRRWPPGRDWGADVRRHGLERELNTCQVRFPGPIHHAGARVEAARRRRRDHHRELPQQCRPPAPSLRVMVAEGAMISARRPLTRRRGRRGRPPRGDRGRRRASGRVGCHGLACWERGRTATGMGTAGREKPSLGGLRRGKWVVVPQLKSSLSSGPAPAWGMTAVLHWQV